MPNPNPPKDPDISEKGKATRFGAPGGPDPVESAQKANEVKECTGLMREQLRYISQQPIDQNLDNIDAELKRLTRMKDGKTTLARVGAVRLLERFIKKGDPAAATVIMENTEGKLSQEIILPKPKRAPLDKITPENAEAMYKEFMPS